MQYLEYTGQLQIDRQQMQQQNSDHFSNISKQFDIIGYFPSFQEQLVNILGQQSSDFIQQYMGTVLSTTIFGLLLYFTFSTALYVYFFKLKKDKYLPNFEGDLKIPFDIKISVINILGEVWLISLIRMLWPKLSYIYYDINEYSYYYIPISILLHMIYDETLTYWVHRLMHTVPFLYEKLHYLHHKSLDVTPFSGFAFHPLDAFLQALGTFTSCFWFPIHINIVLVFSFMTTFWALTIHDNVPLIPCKLFLYSTHHTIHHEIGKGSMSNYGKFTSIWDRIMKSYCDPDRIDYGWKEFQNRISYFKKFNNLYGKIVKDLSSFTPSTNKKKIT